MAVIYLSSVDGSDADNGSTWALAKATLAAALTAAGAGGTVYVDDAHTETQASAMTLTSPGTAASPVKVLCGTRASGAPPTALATTGTVSTTGASLLTLDGFAYCYGLTFSSGSGASSSSIIVGGVNPFTWTLDACRLKLANTNTASRIQLGVQNSAALVVLNNTVLEFGSVSQAAFPNGRVIWQNTPSAIGGSVPAILFVPVAGNRGGSVLIKGVDLSAAGSGKTIFTRTTGLAVTYTVLNCKRGASSVLATGTSLGQGGPIIRAVNFDSADTNYQYELDVYEGTITHETTIVRTGGASDGTTPIARKMVSTADSNFYSPLVSDPCVIWNEATGSAITATIEIVTDNVTLTDAEAWIEVEYLGTSGFPLAGFASDRAANILATPANQTSSSETWTTTGLGTPVKQKLSVSFTPQEKGPIAVRVHLAKASTTLYFDPKVVLS